MNCDSSDSNSNAWLAYGPGKDDWKLKGNYFTADELKKFQQESGEVSLSFCPEPIWSAD